MSDIYTGIDLGTDSVKVVVCEKLNDKHINFGLSNVFENKGTKNEKIIKWCEDNNWKVYSFDKHTYTACGKGNSNAKEVFITNYKMNN